MVNPSVHWAPGVRPHTFHAPTPLMPPPIHGAPNMMLWDAPENDRAKTGTRCAQRSRPTRKKSSTSATGQKPTSPRNHLDPPHRSKAIGEAPKYPPSFDDDGVFVFDERLCK